jgi:uncharacterized membrane protein YqhA
MQRETQSAAADTPPGRAPGPLEGGAERALAFSLRLTIIPVAVLVLAGFGAFAYGIALFVHSVQRIVDHPFPVGHQVGLFLLDIDLFLIGVTLLISAVGLYELFISEVRVGAAISLPAWLDMHDLNDLKGRVIGMIVMVLAVSFAEVAVDFPVGQSGQSGQQLLELGGGIAVVIVALTAFLRLTGHGNGKSGPG